MGLCQRSDDVSDDKPQWTESDRSELDEFLAERKFRDLLAARRKRRMESVRGWASLIVLIFAVGSQIGGAVAWAWQQIVSIGKP